MSIVMDACDRILTCLQKISPWDAQNFQPGLSYEEIEQKSKELLYSLTPELYELYQWRNGNPWSNNFILANYWMLSLENALDAYCLRGSFADIRDLYGYDGSGNYISEDDNFFWNRHWFPIFRSRDEHRFWVVKIGEDSSPILDVDPNEHYIEMYPSLTEMLISEAECFEKAIELVGDLDNFSDGIYSNDIYSRLMNIRHKHGYKLRHF